MMTLENYNEIKEWLLHILINQRENENESSNIILP